MAWALLASALVAGSAFPSEAPAVHEVRRLALVVGVGEYLNAKLPDLEGATLDARAVYELLTAPAGGYGFATDDVELLLDERATVEGFREAFARALVERARAGDVVVLYYAGHGSQVRDANGDEPDGWDESLLLHDSRAGEAKDLLDDELNRMLEELHAKTRNITVLLDTCNSGSATRDDVWAVARAVPRLGGSARLSGARGPRLEVEGGDGSEGGWSPRSLPGLVVLSAAKDGTPALEEHGGGHGFFTSALLEVLGGASAEPLTWAQVARRMPRRVAALSRNRQLPTFQGALERYVFDARERRRPFGWEVVELGEEPGGGVELRGIDLPGWGPEALVRIYPGNLERHEAGDPSKAKATLRIESYRGLSATASPIGSLSRPIEIGDLATLMLPSPEANRLRVRLAPRGAPGGLEKREIRELTRALEADATAKGIVMLTEETDVFSVRKDEQKGFQIYGPEGVLRNTFGGPAERQIGDVTRSLAQHARQTALLMLEGEGGGDFENGQTLEVRLVPLAGSGNEGAGWVQAAPNAEQSIPLGARWQIEVTNTDDEATLLIGGAVLWNDGGIDAVPFAGDEVRLPPGKTAVLDPRTAFEAVPPTDALEHVVIFGTREDNPVNWSLLTDPAAGSEREAGGGPLQYLLAGYLDGVRAGRRLAVSTSTWTSSHVPFRVVGSPRAAEGGPADE